MICQSELGWLMTLIEIISVDSNFPKFKVG